MATIEEQLLTFYLLSKRGDQLPVVESLTSTDKVIVFDESTNKISGILQANLLSAFTNYAQSDKITLTATEDDQTEFEIPSRPRKVAVFHNDAYLTEGYAFTYAPETGSLTLVTGIDTGQELEVILLGVNSSTGLGNAPVAATYANLAALVAAQGVQSLNFIYEVTDGSDFTGIDSGILWVKYLGTMVGDETDYTWMPRPAGGGAVDSVNAQTGVVVLDADDIDDSATTNKWTNASDIAKLAGIETGADVTDAANVDAAGAVMNSDTTTASMSFVIDEDDMVSDSATKVPTQQSVKAYVDANAGENDLLLSGNTFVEIYNPYDKIQPNKLKGQIHCHTNNSPDGADAPIDVCDMYEALGFDFITITDHNFITTEPVGNNLIWLCDSYESTRSNPAETEQHMNVLGAESVFGGVGYTAFDTFKTVEEIIDHYSTNGNKILQLNHPNFVSNYYPDTSLNAVSNGFALCEVWNVNGSHNDLATACRAWDILLSRGFRVFATATDDYHNSGHEGKGWIEVNSELSTKESIIKSISEGNFIASNGTSAVNSISIISVELVENKITIVIGANATIRFIGNNGVLLKESVSVTTSFYDVIGTENYVRIEVINGTEAKWLQPFFVDTKKIYQRENTENTLLVGKKKLTAFVSGSFAFDWSLYDFFDLTMTANTVFSDYKLPVGEFVDSMKVKLKGAYTPTFPSYYRKLTGDTYLGSVDNAMELQNVNSYDGYKEVWYKLFNLSEKTLLASIISYFKFNNNLNDSITGLSAAGTSVTYGAGKVGDAAILNGTSSYIRVNDTDAYTFTDGFNDLPFSISVNLKFSSFNAATQHYIISRRDTSVAPLQEWYFAFVSGKLRFICFDDDGNYIFAEKTGFTPTIGTWYHLVATYDGSKSENGFQIYIDGVLQTSLIRTISGAYAGMSNTTSLTTIGRNNSVSSFYLPAQIDELILFGKELDLSEVNEIKDANDLGLSLL